MKGNGNDQFQTMVSSCQDFYSGIHWMTTQQFKARQDGRNWCIVDVRSLVERKVSVIPDSISIDEYRENIDVFRGRPVLVYCTVGCRSAGVAQQLHEQGVEVYNLWGGVVDWATHSGEFVTLEGKPTRIVHTHGRRWDLVPPPYIAVW
jgi:rhodanese-related sulfurtransferase